jgi:NAD(P)-dependent dehydrogenase (short-subunit alcohol dehydrogenase family)
VGKQHPEKTTTLVTKGVYQYSRNPMSLGFLFLLVAWGFYLGSLITFIVLPLFIWFITRDLESARAVAREIDADEKKVLGLQFNLEDRATFGHLIKQSLERYGKLDLLVNNALSNSGAMPLFDTTDEQIEFALTSNITNTLLLTRKCYPELVKTRGSVINISSVIVNRHVFGLPIYNITKGAINQMTKALASEWAGNRVRVNAINPGFVYISALEGAGMNAAQAERMYKFCEQFHPLDRIIGSLVAFLASDEASFITGAIINSDGGYSIQGISNIPSDL